MKRLLVIGLVASTGFLASCSTTDTEAALNQSLDELAAEMAPTEEEVPANEIIPISELFDAIIADGSINGPAAEKYGAMKSISIQGEVQAVEMTEKGPEITLSYGDNFPFYHKVSGVLKKGTDVSMLKDKGEFNKDEGSTVVLTGKISQVGDGGSYYYLQLYKPTLTLAE